MKATLKRKTQKFVEDGKKHEVWQQGRSYNLGRFILSLTLLSGVLYMLFVLYMNFMTFVMMALKRVPFLLKMSLLIHFYNQFSDSIYCCIQYPRVFTDAIHQFV